MANHISPQVCIDFYGLPGSGKSTISHIVAEKLRNKGWDIKEVSYEMDHSNSSSYRIIKKFSYTIFFLISRPIVFFKLVKTIADNGGDIFRNIVNLSYKVVNLGSNKQIVLFDEGFCQAVLSISLGSPNYDKDIYAKLSKAIKNNREVINVYLNTDYHTAIQRIFYRQDGLSRVEKLSEEDMKNLLKYQAVICDMLPSSIVLNDSENIDSKANTLSNQIEEKLKILYKMNSKENAQLNPNKPNRGG